MLKRAVLQSLAGVLVMAALVGVWMLRPSTETPTLDALILQVEPECDSAQRACRIFGADVELELRLGPPVRTLESFDISLRSLRGHIGSDAQVTLQFQMRDMAMGLNRYRLVADADAVWHGKAVLPVCSAGRSDWIAQVEITAAGRHWRAELPFTTVSR